MPPDDHARLAPSGSHCWTHCTMQPSFLKANADKVHDSDSEYSILGTTQHEWNEKLLNGTVELADIPEEHRSYAETWRDHVTSLCTDFGEQYVEAKVPLYYSPLENGTVDFAWVSEKGVFIRDYKHGAGVFVSAEFNTQLAIYAQSLLVDLMLSGLYDFDPATPVSIGIVQPRCRDADDEDGMPVAPRVWETTVAELALFCETHIDPAIAKIQSGEGLEFAPSEDVCRWCPAKPRKGNKSTLVCEARVNAALEGFPPSLNPLHGLVDLDGAEGCLTDDQILSLIKNADVIKNLAEEAKLTAFNRALENNPIPGTKLVMGREGNRQWSSEEAVETLFRNQKLKAEDFSKRVFLSPAAMEKHEVIKAKFKDSERFKNRFAALIERAPAKKVVALEDDKRPSVNPGPDDSQIEGLEDIEE